jgi:two-component sensor histidine kinase
VLPEDRVLVKAAFRAQRSGRDALTLEFGIHRAGDGDIRWLEARGALHEGPDGAGAAIPAAARLAFQARLLALARSHEVLTREGWIGADLGELVGLALAPHETTPAGRHCVVEGPALRVPPRLAVPLVVALHELAANAARHDALSVPEGCVAVRWRLEPGLPTQPAMLRLCWKESGGPPVQAPLRRGFGTRLLESGLGRELGGTVRLGFRPKGEVCDIAAPLPAQVSAEAASER